MDDLGVPARGEEDHRRWGEFFELNPGRHEMALHVIDADKWELACPSGRFGERMTHQESPHQTGPGGGGNAVEVIRVNPCFVESVVSEGSDRLDMCPGRNLGYHPAKPGMEIHLGRNHVGQNSLSSYNGYRGLVTRRLEGEDGRVHRRRSSRWA